MSNNFKFLGDVHLGRVFKNGVPLHRRGERERMVFEQFKEELYGDFDVLIQVGDLFNAFRVDLNVVMEAFRVISRAAENQYNKMFYFLAGNHDLSRDTDKVSSLDILKEMLSGYQNVEFVINYPSSSSALGVSFALIPYSPTQPAGDCLGYTLCESFTNSFDFIVGHWDHVSIGDDHNLIPLDTLASVTSHAISGHDHVAKSYSHGPLKVDVIGSMQPYSFSEDPNETLYVTRTLDTLGDLEQYKNKCLRIILKEGEVAPEVDCLLLKIKKEDEEEPSLEVKFEDGLDLTALFESIMNGSPVVDEIRTKFKEVMYA